MLRWRTQLRLEQLDERWMPDAEPLPGTTIPAAEQVATPAESDELPTWESLWAGDDHGTADYGDKPQPDGPAGPAGPAGPTVVAAGGVTITPDGRVSIWPPPEKGTRISGPGRINLPVGTVVVITDRTADGDAEAIKKVTPDGTPISTGATGWDGVRGALGAQPAGKVTALVISGHGNGTGGVTSSGGGLNPADTDANRATIDAIKSQLAPGAPIIILGCNCGFDVNIANLQMLADATGHPVIVSTGDCGGNETNGDWIRIDPRPKP